jgi:hypothetical protein
MPTISMFYGIVIYL